MDEYKTLFSEYMKNFKEAPTNVKRQEVFDSVKELFKTFEILCVNDGVELDFLKGNEFLDPENQFEDEDDYLYDLAVCVENAKNIIGVYLESQEKNI